LAEVIYFTLERYPNVLGNDVLSVTFVHLVCNDVPIVQHWQSKTIERYFWIFPEHSETTFKNVRRMRN